MVFEDERSYYDTALICLNGHVINSHARTNPQHNSKFCKECGAATFDACQSCHATIRGYYHVAGWVELTPTYNRPMFCPDCGSPYPWTEGKLAAAKELAQELEDLSDEERNIVSASLDDVVRDTPRTELATARLKRLLAKAGKEGAGAMKTILIQIATTAAKEQMGL